MPCRDNNSSAASRMRLRVSKLLSALRVACAPLRWLRRAACGAISKERLRLLRSPEFSKSLIGFSPSATGLVRHCRLILHWSPGEARQASLSAGPCELYTPQTEH